MCEGAGGERSWPFGKGGFKERGTFFSLFFLCFFVRGVSLFFHILRFFFFSVYSPF